MRFAEVLGYVGLAWLLIRCCSGCSTAGAATTPDKEVARPEMPKSVSFDPAVLERLGLRTEPAGSAANEHRLQVAGTIEYDLDHYAEVGTVTEGRVTNVQVRAGESVRKGQPLATLFVPTVAAVQADAVVAKASAELAKEHADRERDLLGRDLTTKREAEMADADSTRSDALLAASSARLRALGVARPSGTADVAAGRLSLAAPIDGVVVKRDAVVGSFLHPKDTAFVIADPKKLWATLEIFEADVMYLEMGAEAQILVDAMPGKIFKGHITQVEPRIGAQTRTVRARIAVPNEQGLLRAGLFVRASIQLPEEERRARLLLTAGAVQPLGTGEVVFVKTGPGDYEIRPVRTLRRSSQFVEILDGLKRGEPVVVDKAFLLRGEATKS